MNSAYVIKAVCALVELLQKSILGEPDEETAYPFMIYHQEDLAKFYEASKAEQVAWNGYAAQAAHELAASPSSDIGRNRDGVYTNWCPPMFFPEWLAQYRAGKVENGEKSNG